MTNVAFTELRAKINSALKSAIDDTGSVSNDSIATRHSSSSTTSSNIANNNVNKAYTNAKEVLDHINI